MGLNPTLIIVGVLVISVWLIIEFKRFKHKILAMFLIALIIFTYVSFAITLKGQEVDFTSVKGIRQASKLYFSWLGSVFGNLKSITTNAIKMNWRSNESIEEMKLKEIKLINS